MLRALSWARIIHEKFSSHIFIFYPISRFSLVLTTRSIPAQFHCSGRETKSLCQGMPSRKKKAVKVPKREFKDEKDQKEKLQAVSVSKSDFHYFSEKEIRKMRLLMLSWYDSKKRDLPWRKISKEDVNQQAYSVWVSEIMLQQTQVATVISYYNKWMQKWPSLESLAKADIEEVNSAWSGLGYYSRGKRLLEGAKKVVGELKGQMPGSAEELEKVLPGVGRYTAGAIASIALGQVTGLVDGNVIRVFSRLRMIGGNSTRQDVVDTFWSLANQLVDPSRPGDFNQSLMELGATVCTPKTPSCAQCPVQSLCRAYAKADKDKKDSSLKLCKSEVKQEQLLLDIECLVPDCQLCLPPEQPWKKELGVLNFPRKPKKAEARQERQEVLVLCGTQHDGPDKFLICQRPEKGLLAGLWEFPSQPLTEKKGQGKLHLQQVYGLNPDCVKQLQAVGEVSHQFSHLHHTYHILWVVLPLEEVIVSAVTSAPARWVTEEELRTAGISTGMRKVFKACQGAREMPMSGAKRKRSDDVVITSPRKSQKSISDFFKAKTS